MESEGHLLVVGQPYIAGKTSFPEGVEYAWRGGAHTLRLFFARPSAKEKREIRKGLAEFALVVEPPAILILFRFGSMEWSDASYSVRLEAPEDQIPPPPVADAERFLCTSLLIDAATGLLEVIRVSTFSHVFTDKLHQAIRDQIAAPFGAEAYHQHVTDLYRANPTSTRLLRLAVARCAAGD